MNVYVIKNRMIYALSKANYKLLRDGKFDLDVGAKKIGKVETNLDVADAFGKEAEEVMEKESGAE